LPPVRAWAITLEVTVVDSSMQGVTRRPDIPLWAVLNGPIIVAVSTVMLGFFLGLGWTLGSHVAKIWLSL
jgi:hypothetical protein